MVKLDQITTGTGDQGVTSLADGQRVAKYSLRVSAYGGVDELNSLLGVVRLEQLPDEIAGELVQIQNDLFDLGSDLATPVDENRKFQVPRIGDGHIERLQSVIASVAERLEPAPSFVLPGGSRASAYLHMARSVARRVEREGWALAAEVGAGGPMNLKTLTYLNRLSDLCFVWARLCNDCGRGDLLWQPCKNC